jgi:hydroxysqualene synthase
MAVDQHYENFPVASWLVPAHIRPYVAAIYRFARAADDIADEGNASPNERLQSLSPIEIGVIDLFNGKSTNNKIASNLNIIWGRNLEGISAAPFLALLSAFKQDVVKKRYASLEELLDYANRSANPVGRLMLALFSVRSDSAMQSSDAICTALQLINFWQDAAIDASRGRIYVPHDAFLKHGTDETDFPSHPKHRELMRAQCEHANAMLWSGASLLQQLRGRFRYEIAFTIAGGARILEKIEANDFDVSKRPTLRWYDSARLVVLAWRALKLSQTAARPEQLVESD